MTFLISKIKGIKETTLIKNGFREYDFFDKNEKIYIKRIYLKDKNKYMRLNGEINIRIPSGVITYNVTDQNGQLYAPYYNQEWHHSHKEIVKRINELLKAEVKVLDTRSKNKKKCS